MKDRLIHLIALILLFTGCGPVSKNKSGKENLSITDTVRSEKLMPDTLIQLQIRAFGDLFFGMSRADVIRKNEARQQLGKNEYNFSYNFNGDSVLYKVSIKSDGVKVIQFDNTLKALYLNLYQILETRYGEPLKHNKFPSVFDVQEAGKYLMDEWVTDNKQIEIFLRENALNSYAAVCEITEPLMEKAELQRLKDIKNKDVIEASKKF